jgi:hypothetical protein
MSVHNAMMTIDGQFYAHAIEFSHHIWLKSLLDDAHDDGAFEFYMHGFG